MSAFTSFPQRGLKATFNGGLGTSRSFSGMGGSAVGGRGPSSLLSSASFSIHTDHLGSELGLKRKAEEEEEEVEEELDEVAIHGDPDTKDTDMGGKAPALPLSIHVDDSNSPIAMAISPSSASSTPPALLPFTYPNASRPVQSHLLLSDYQPSILYHLLQSQHAHLPSPTYLSMVQVELNPRMREILIDWMHEVVGKFKLQQETLFLSCHLIDRFLSLTPVGRRRLQLVGCVALLLACKYEEMLVPEVDDFVHISDKAYTREEVIQMEGTMLNALHFELTSPSPLRFVECMEAHERVKGLGGEGVKELSVYMLHVTLQHYHFLHYRPALLALACWVLAGRTMKGEGAAGEWRRAGQVSFRCEDMELTQCMEAVWESWRQMNLTAGEVGEGGLVGSKFRAVERRFSEERGGGRVASVVVIRPGK